MATAKTLAKEGDSIRFGRKLTNLQLGGNLRYLITGGAGFIGSHLAEALLARGDEVFILDDLSTGSVENIRHLKTHDRFHYFFDSIRNKHLWPSWWTNPT